MRIYDIIEKKRDGFELTHAEIAHLIGEYVNGNVPDYQIAAFLMAIYFNLMTENETAALTIEMAKSGDMIDLSAISGIKADKHSTGGVGDKTTLVVLPIAAACGVLSAKMSGRGLGYTGGTIDKLESIPGYQTQISHEKFIENVRNVGASLIGQSGNICPADKKIYALRDVTATVDCMPLIASSIMSKKIASGADVIVLDVKMGSGAFMSTREEAVSLARKMVGIGRLTGRKTVALITSMEKPLGKNIGNALEVIEACETLKNNGPKDLTELCVELAAQMIFLCKRAENISEAREMAVRSIKDGSAFKKFKQIVNAHGGDTSYLEDTDKLEIAKIISHITAPADGYIVKINAKMLGIASVILGAGRETKESTIDYGAGIILHKSIGDKVKRGEKIASLLSGTQVRCKEAESVASKAFTVGDDKPEKMPMIIDFVE